MLRPTFLAFETAKRALNVAQAGLDVVGNNMANVNTPGYTRQRALQTSVNNSFQSKFQVFGARGHFTGQGVDLGGISQIRDPYLDTRFRIEATTQGHHAVKSSGLGDLERIIDEIAKTGIHHSLTELISQISRFAQNPDSPEVAVVVRNAAMQLAQVFNRTASDMQAVLENQMFDLEVSVRNDVNSALERIAYLNERIRQDHMFGSPANELNDERNLLIDQLSHFLPIQVVRTPERISGDRVIERVSIQLNTGAGNANIMLVDNDRFNILGTEFGEGGGAAITLIEGNSGFVLRDVGDNGNITEFITGGGIRGFLDVINGVGDFAGHGENAFRGIPYYQKALDVKAQTFARLMNQMNSINSEEAERAGIGAFYHKNLFWPNLPVDQALNPLSENDRAEANDRITAANITISPHWLAEASFFTTTKQAPSLPIPVLDQNGNHVYDSEGNQVFRTPSNTDNILAFRNLLNQDNIVFSSFNNNGEQFILFRGTFQESLISMQSTAGLDKSMNDSLLRASDVVLGGFADRRDSISAVSMDEEAVNMMVLQNFYNAAARYMTVIDEALGTIIERMGVVGR